jgi:hypothetical protein
MSSTKTITSIEEFEQQFGPKTYNAYQRKANSYFIDEWEWVCRHCYLDECARPEGRHHDLTPFAQRRFALFGCAISKAGLKGVDANYVRQHPEEFNLLSEAELKEKWG